MKKLIPFLFIVMALGLTACKGRGSTWRNGTRQSSPHNSSPWHPAYRRR